MTQAGRQSVIHTDECSCCARAEKAEKALAELQGWSPTGRTVLYSEVVAERDDLRAKLAAAEAHQKKLIELVVNRPERHTTTLIGTCDCHACALDQAAKELCKAWDERDAALARVRELEGLLKRFDLTVETEQQMAWPPDAPVSYQHWCPRLEQAQAHVARLREEIEHVLKHEHAASANLQPAGCLYARLYAVLEETK